MSQQWTFQYVNKLFNEKLLEDFRGEKHGYIQVGPKKYLFPMQFSRDGPLYADFLPRATDTWLITFPRSGTTLTQELIWLLSNNFDYETASAIPLTQRFPFLEFSSCVNPALLEILQKNITNPNKLKILNEATSLTIPIFNANKGRRFIKTHLPFSLLNPNLLNSGAKIIYVARNPKDVIPSFFHLHRLFKTLDYTGDIDNFYNYFEKDLIFYCPYWAHIEEGLAFRNHKQVLVLHYEDMTKNMMETIYHIANFLNVQCTKEDALKLADHLKIDNFRQNPSVNFEFLRGTGMLNDTYNERFIRYGGGQSTNICINHTIQQWIKKYTVIVS